jgi:signal peptidase II
VWRRWFSLSIAALVAITDQLTKYWIKANLLPGESFPEIGNLTIIHIQNTGSAFGLFPNQTILLTIIAIAGLVVIFFFFRYLPQSILSSITLGLIVGGDLGNLTDRIRLGHVTDFIYFRLWNDVYWPAFNVADSSITVGSIALAIILLVDFKKKDGQSCK